MQAIILVLKQEQVSSLSTLPGLGRLLLPSSSELGQR
jgi:hypothetical protein